MQEGEHMYFISGKNTQNVVCIHNIKTLCKILREMNLFLCKHVRARIHFELDHITDYFPKQNLRTELSRNIFVA